MKEADYNKGVYWMLMQLIYQAKHSINEISEKYGLTAMQSNTLTMLGDGKALAMSALSNHFMCDASNVTGIADRLEARGLIERQDHPTDRRIKLIALTPEGVKLRDIIMSETVAAEGERLNPILSEAERAMLQELLDKILKSQRNRPA